MQIGRKRTGRWRLALITLLQVGIILVSANAQPEKANTDPESEASRYAPVLLWDNVHFATMGGHDLSMNIYRPADVDLDVTLPLIVMIHGGGWKGTNHATKWLPEGSTQTMPVRLELRENGGPIGPPQGWSAYPWWIMPRGYVMASVSYRSSDIAHFPDPLKDCKASIRWLRAHADEYNFDPERVGAFGGSAGGHLVSLVGTTIGVEDLEQQGPYKEYSSSVQAVAAAASPTDFMDIVRRFPDGSYDKSLDLVSMHLGCEVKDNPEKAQRANPIAYITGDEPPFLITHGDIDKVVPVSQSELLHEALVKAGVDSTLYISEGAGHFGGGKDHPHKGQDRIMDFFDKHLK